MRRVALIFTLAVAFVVAGCGGQEHGGPAGDGAAGGGGAAQTIQVSATDFAFDPANISASAGEIAIELTNDGEVPHAIEVEGNGVEKSSEGIQPGESTTLTLDLGEGTYEVYCPVGNHADMGMAGSLTVASGGGGAETTDGESETGETETDGAPGY